MSESKSQVKTPTSGQPPEKPFDIALLIQVIGYVSALLILYVTYDSIVRDREDSTKTASRELSAITDLAVDDISRGLGGVRDTLRLLSHMPSFRQTTQAGVLSPLVREVLSRLEEAADSVGGRFDAIDLQTMSSFQDLTMFQEIFMAAGRRILFSIGFFGIAQDFWRGISGGAQAEEEPEVLPGMVPEITSLAAPTKVPVFLGRWFREFRESWSIPTETMIRTAVFLDSAFLLGTSVVSDVVEARRVLIASLNDRDLIRSLSVKTLEGKTIAEATEIGEPLQFLSNWMVNSAREGRPFLCGPVTFDEGLGRPLWQAAVPLRNEDRIPFGVLSSQVDLSFLSEIATRLKISPASHLLVVDEEGTVIAHPKISMVVTQVNVSRSNPVIGEVLKGEEGFRELRWNGISYFAAFRNLKKADPANLPGWGILFLAPVSELSASWWKSVMNGVILAAIGLYLLYYTVDIILASIEEGTEA